jgi:glutathione S-transferase
MRLNHLIPSTFSARVRMQVYAKGIDIEMNHVTFPVDEEYRRRTGTGKVPSLEVDGYTLIESTAIGEYLEDLGKGPSLRPTAPLERAKMRMLMQINDLYIAPNLAPFIMAVVHGSHDPAVLANAKPKLFAGLDLLESRLEGQSYAVGSALSLADCAMVPTLVYLTGFLPMLGITDPLRDHPRIAAYFDAIAKDPAAARIIEEMRSFGG